jgi:hypothetical protein
VLAGLAAALETGFKLALARRNHLEED